MERSECRKRWAVTPSQDRNIGVDGGALYRLRKRWVSAPSEDRNTWLDRTPRCRSTRSAERPRPSEDRNVLLASGPDRIGLKR